MKLETGKEAEDDLEEDQFEREDEESSSVDKKLQGMPEHVLKRHHSANNP